MKAKDITPDWLARRIDHAVLAPAATLAEVAEGCAVAARHRVAGFCARPCDVAEAAERLRECPEVAVGTVIGFPHGTTTTRAKVAEARQAVLDGAGELDMVLNIARLRSGDGDFVADDIAAVVAAGDGHLVKVILECCYLDRDQMSVACEAARRAGADFVKTSTGFGPTGATVEDVRFLRGQVGDKMQVKAAGGIRTLEAAMALIDAGADRIGTSSTEKILAELRQGKS